MKRRDGEGRSVTDAEFEVISGPHEEPPPSFWRRIYIKHKGLIWVLGLAALAGGQGLASALQKLQ